MCRTVHALLQTLICGIQMLVRVFMTVILMIENLIRMILQTLYNFISFLLQMLSLIPICIVFLLTARLKCFMCGGGGPCPVNRGGACDCIMSAIAILIMFFIFRATGTLDKIFYSLGYAKARVPVHRFVPTPGDITECSRNDTEYTLSTEYIVSTEYTEETTTLNNTDSGTDNSRYLRTDELMGDFYALTTASFYEFADLTIRPFSGQKKKGSRTSSYNDKTVTSTANNNTTNSSDDSTDSRFMLRSDRKWTTVLSYFQ